LWVRLARSTPLAIAVIGGLSVSTVISLLSLRALVSLSLVWFRGGEPPH